MNKTFDEIKKIRWVKKSELFKTSVVVILTIVFVSFVFIGYDAILAQLIKLIFG